MLFCDRCDRGYHTFCVGLRALPDGNWICPLFCGGSGTVVRGLGPAKDEKEDIEEDIEECSECGRQMSKKKRGRNGICKDCQQ
jgi:hypothetical protein